jgi:hypothetical protein
MWTPSGTKYDGSEVSDALSKNPEDSSNAKEGRKTYLDWSEKVAAESKQSQAATDAANVATTTAHVEKLLDTPLDLTALNESFDRQIDATRQAGARNKALALKAIQERGAASGSSVNQMMGMQTEAGYGYDTQNQAQETMLGLQKEMAKVEATKEDANRKLNWAMTLYNNAKTDEQKNKAWNQYLAQQDILKQQQIYQSNIEAEMNSPSLAMTLAKVGVGVGGAVLAPFTGGTSLLVAGAAMGGLQAADSAGAFGSGAQAYNTYRAGMPAPGPQNLAPGSLTYRGTAPGYGPSWGMHNGNASVNLGT